MNKEQEIALYKYLGSIDGKLDHLLELKPEIKSNTKFRYYSMAFLVLFTGFVGLAVQLDRLKINSGHSIKITKASQ